MAWPGIQSIKNETLRARDRINVNNIYRTIYYLRYWERNPEVPWALLAHLVSRNAGYQMSDLARFRAWKTGVLLAAGGALIIIERSKLPAHAVIALDKIVNHEFAALFALLETGNFLILRDVYPQLRAYELAKAFPEHSEELFEMLALPEFGVDPFMRAEWRTFFAAARASNWFPNWPSEPAVQRLSFAVIINEQNQIEDRLLHDPRKKYLKPFGALLGPQRLISWIVAAGWTKLAFPFTPAPDNPVPQSLLVYTVDDFLSLGGRIQTGRNLFAGLFNAGRRWLDILPWVRARALHSGTRFDYNRGDYSPDPLSAAPAGAKYSAQLVEWYGPFYDADPPWPLEPGRMGGIFRHLHDKPAPLPVAISARPRDEVEAWLSPLAAPTRPLEPKPLGALAEIPF